jgi:hypothetical protein
VTLDEFEGESSGEIPHQRGSESSSECDLSHDELAESVAALKQSLHDLESGVRGKELSEFIAGVRREQRVPE